MLPERDHTIATRTMNQLIQNYKDSHEATAESPILHKFHADQVKKLVSTPDCSQFVVAKGLSAEGCEIVILQGLDSKGTLLGALEYAFPCPPNCG